MRLPCLHLGLRLPAGGLIGSRHTGEGLGPLSPVALERFQPQQRPAASSRAPVAELRASALDTEATEPGLSSQGGQAWVSKVHEPVSSAAATIVVQNVPGCPNQAFVSCSALR